MLQVFTSPEPRQEPPRFEIVARDGKPVDEPTQKGRTLTGESPLIVLPGLACEVGLPEAVFLQQLHYWLTGDKAHERDGRRWVYNTVDEWHEQFPFLSRSALFRVIQNLEKQGLIVGTSKYNQSKIDRTKWYAINYDHPCLEGFDEGVRTKSHIRNMHVANPEYASRESGISDTPIPETNVQEITTETNDPPTPQAELNGHAPVVVDGFRPTWPGLLGERYVKVRQKFGKLSPEFTDGMFRNLLIEVERDVGQVPPDALVAGLQSAWSALERKLVAEKSGSSKPVGNLRPYAKSIMVAKVREAVV